MRNTATEESIEAAAELISDADGLIITAGAGIGIDSGLPDFRGGAWILESLPRTWQAWFRIHANCKPKGFQNES